MKYFKKLVGENIYLSPRSAAEKEDVELFTEWLNDFETTDYIGRTSQIISIEAEKEYLEKTSNTDVSFLIIRKSDDTLIGTVGLEQIDYINRIATLGIFIGEKTDRSKGYGTEAIKLLLDFAFNYLNLNNVKLDLLAINERALACYKKCGFKEYGRRRKCRYINGKYYDIISMDILSEEFKEDYIKNKHIK